MSDTVDFSDADNHESLLQIDTKIFWWIWLSIPEVPKKASWQRLYSIPKKVREEVDFFWSWKCEGHGDENDQAFSKYSK